MSNTVDVTPPTVKKQHVSIADSVRRAVADRPVLWNLLLRDLRSRYRRTVFGWSWSMLNPAITTAVYGFVFTVFFKILPDPGRPSGMTSFTFYLLSGILPWNALVNGTVGGMGGLLGGAHLMSKVRFAREHLVLATVMAMFVSLAIELCVLIILELATGYSTLHLLPIAVLLVLLLGLFTSGVSLILSAINLRYRDVQHITNIFFLVWFYITPVIYPTKVIPLSKEVFGVSLPVRQILGFNPMSRFLLAFRNCFFDITPPGLNTLLGLTAISVLTFAVGYVFFVRRSPWFVEEL
jgi:ABC-type polysaccharide/polyol phosphate export permease